MFHFHKIKIRETSAVFLSFSAVPAICTHLWRVYPCGIKHIVQAVISQRSKPHPLTDFFHHLVIAVGVGIRIIIENGPVHVFSFLFCNNTAGNQFHFRIGTGKIQILAAKQDGRTRCTGMNLFCAAFKKKLRRFPKLRPSDNGICLLYTSDAADD
mgnify:CR=1 FL=1